MQIRKSSIAFGVTISTLGSLVSVVNADSVTVPSSVANLTNGPVNFASTVRLNMDYKGDNPHSGAGSGTFVGENKIITSASNFLHLVDGRPQFIGDDSSTYTITTPTGLTQTFHNKDIHFIDKDNFGNGQKNDIAVVVIPGYKRTSPGSGLASYPDLAVSNGNKVSAFGMGTNGFNALVEQPIRKIEKTDGSSLVSYGEGLQSSNPGLRGGGIFNSNGKLVGIHLGTTPHEAVDGVIFTQPQLDKIKEIVNSNSPESTMTTTKPIVTVYEADPELEGGRERIASQGVAEVVDGTGRVITPGQPKIIKKGTKGYTTRVEQAFSISYENDPTLPLGETRVKTPGSVGYVETVVTYTFDKTLNKLTRSDVVNRVAPINEVRLRGTHVESIPNPNNVNASHILAEPVVPNPHETPTTTTETPKPVGASSDTISDANRIPNPNNVGASHVLADPVVPKLPENPRPVETPTVTKPVDKPVETPTVTKPVDKPVETPTVTKPVDKPVETPTVTKPVETPTVTKPVDKPVETSTVTKPVETPTVTKPVETPTVTKPVDKPVETPTVTKPVDEPVETPTVTKPVETPTVTKPVETPTVTKPVDKPTVTKPVDKPTVTKPVDKPVETPTVTKPVDKPTVTKPVDKPTVTKPVDKPTVTKPVDKPVETPTVTKPVETPTVTKPVETPTVTKPVETSTVTKPVETSTVTKPVETSTVTKPSNTKTATRNDGTIKHSIKYSNAAERQSAKTLPNTGMAPGFGLTGFIMSVFGSIGLKKRKNK